MIKNLNKKNNHDLLHQFQWIHPLQKTKLIQATVNTANNRLIKQPKLINPLYFCLTLFLNRKPKIKISKNSIAAFKVRPNIPLGTKNHLHKSSLTFFYNTFITSLLPVFNTQKYNNNYAHASTTRINPSSYESTTFARNTHHYIILLSYGWKDINNPIMNSGEYLLSYPFLDGAHVQWLIKSPVNYLPFYCSDK